MIPTEEECIKLLAKYGNSKDSGAFKHSQKVRDVAVFLGKQLGMKGVNVNLELVAAGALLHDIKKYDELEAYRNGNYGFFHHIEGAKIVETEGYKEIAGIIIAHMCSAFFEGFSTIEEKIVCYADKRVNGTTIVPIAERYEDAAKRYSVRSNEILADLKNGLRLERELFIHLDFKPIDVESLVENGKRLL